MALFNVDFFEYDRTTRRLQNVHHDMVEDPMIDDDYIAANTSTISIQPTFLVSAGQFVNITGAYNFFGVVSAASTANGYTSVTIKPFITIFDEDVLVNVKEQGRSTNALENMILGLLRKYYIYHASDSAIYCTDHLQCLPIVPTVVSSTTSWGFNLKPDVEEGSWCKCGFYDVVLTTALKKYGVGLRVTPNFHRTATINGVTYYGVFEVKIGRMIDGNGNNIIHHIEADLPGVDVVTMEIQERDGVVNKLQVYNTDDYSQVRTYYVHSDKSYNMNNTDRLTPVVREIEYFTPDNDTTFADGADDIAASSLSGLEWSNLIELSVYSTNTLVDPVNLEIGQQVKIHYLGNTYTSILTGKKYDTDITLSFGSERIAFTKQRR